MKYEVCSTNKRSRRGSAMQNCFELFEEQYICAYCGMKEGLRHGSAMRNALKLFKESEQ